MGKKRVAESRVDCSGVPDIWLQFQLCCSLAVVLATQGLPLRTPFLDGQMDTLACRLWQALLWVLLPGAGEAEGRKRPQCQPDQ